MFHDFDPVYDLIETSMALAPWTQVEEESRTFEPYVHEPIEWTWSPSGAEHEDDWEAAAA